MFGRKIETDYTNGSNTDLNPATSFLMVPQTWPVTVPLAIFAVGVAVYEGTSALFCQKVVDVNTVGLIEGKVRPSQVRLIRLIHSRLTWAQRFQNGSWIDSRRYRHSSRQ